MFVLRHLKWTARQWLRKQKVAREIRNHRNDIKVIVGAGATKQAGWISTDYPLIDLTEGETFSALFLPGTINNLLAEHVWEHLTLEEGAKACQNCFLFLKNGGVLRIAVPDGFHTTPEYIDQVKPGGYGAGAEDHKVLFNYRTLSALLESAGFRTRLLEWFDELGEFHHVEWEERDGLVMRSMRFDERNRTNPTAYTSLIIDAVKPE
jgi:predicted SAM-dependent methyltransferase